MTPKIKGALRLHPGLEPHRSLEVRDVWEDPLHADYPSKQKHVHVRSAWAAFCTTLKFCLSLRIIRPTESHPLDSFDPSNRLSRPPNTNTRSDRDANRVPCSANPKQRPPPPLVSFRCGSASRRFFQHSTPRVVVVVVVVVAPRGPAAGGLPIFPPSPRQDQGARLRRRHLKSNYTRAVVGVSGPSNRAHG